MPIEGIAAANAIDGVTVYHAGTKLDSGVVKVRNATDMNVTGMNVADKSVTDVRVVHTFKYIIANGLKAVFEDKRYTSSHCSGTILL
jgi:hypothetical protein